MVSARADGAARLLDLRTTLVTDEKGRPVATVGVGTDITDRTQVEQTLHDSEERLRRAQEGSQLAPPDVPVLSLYDAHIREGLLGGGRW